MTADLPAILRQITVAPPSQWSRMIQVARACLPRELEEIIPWAEQYYKPLGGDSEYFDISRSPWLIEPLKWADDPLTSIFDFAKPIQIGGTCVGEIIIMRWILSDGGLIHYNWPTTDKAHDRWSKFTERRLKANPLIAAIMPGLYEDGFIRFPNATFAMQGVYSSGNLDSDTVPRMVNEELHQWEPGRLGKALGRQTRVTFPKMVNISNASCVGDDFHQSYVQGTMQEFMLKCPHCSNPHHEANTVHHIVRTRWDDRRPDLGGLRYDSDGCRNDDGTFNYNKLIPTLRLQFPCGYQMPDDLRLRREAAQGGKYSEPTNPNVPIVDGAPTRRSARLEAVAAHEIRWLDLVMEKHAALRSLKNGDDANWKRYLQERECQFYSKDSRPFEGQIIVNTAIQKNRTGLPDRAVRVAVFDWQQGYKSKGQLIHYWGTICDFTENCNGQLVFEGKVNSEAELIELYKEYEVDPAHVLIDASKNTKQILQLCYQQGFKAVAGYTSHLGHFSDHPDKVKRFYSAGKPIHAQLNVPPIYEYVFGERKENGEVPLVPDPREPLVIEFNKAGVLSLLFWYREMKARVTANCAEENRIMFCNLSHRRVVKHLTSLMKVRCT